MNLGSENPRIQSTATTKGLYERSSERRWWAKEFFF